MTIENFSEEALVLESDNLVASRGAVPYAMKR